jgi:hypothetical protein
LVFVTGAAVALAAGALAAGLAIALRKRTN